jgi:HEPN domain-containing protein
MSAEENLREADRWMKQAEEDLKAAEVLLKGERYAQACFYSQQTAEKAVKCIWYRNDWEPWGHSVAQMIEEIPDLAVRAKIADLRETALGLDKLYVPTGYPNGLPALIPQQAYTRAEAEEAIHKARLVLDRCRSI